MTPEEKYELYLAESIQKDIKDSHSMSESRFSMMATPQKELKFMVAMQIWQDVDWDYNEVGNICIKYLLDGDMLNNSSYKAIADDLFKFLANQAPGRHIIITINDSVNGLTINYNQ